MSKTLTLAGMGSLTGIALIALAILGNKWDTTDISLPSQIFYAVSGFCMITMVTPHILGSELLLPNTGTISGSILYWLGSVIVVSTIIGVFYTFDPTMAPKSTLTIFGKYRK